VLGSKVTGDARLRTIERRLIEAAGDGDVKSAAA